MPCLQDENDLGELKSCALENQLCMKGEMQFEGNTVDVRRCQLAAGKAGQCEKIHIMEVETEVCYCDTDGCNGTSNVLPQSFAVLLAISAVLMMFGFKWKRSDKWIFLFVKQYFIIWLEMNSNLKKLL